MWPNCDFKDLKKSKSPYQIFIMQNAKIFKFMTFQKNSAKDIMLFVFQLILKIPLDISILYTMQFTSQNILAITQKHFHSKVT